MRGVSLTHPVLVSFLSGEFLLHIPCWLLFFCFLFFFSLGSFSYTSLLAFFFFFFYLGSFSYTSRAGFIFSWGVSLTHPKLASYLWGEFLLHILCCFVWFLFLFFISGVSLTHPMLGLFFCGEFLLHIPTCLIFLWGVSLTHPMLFFFFF